MLPICFKPRQFRNKKKRERYFISPHLQKNAVNDLTPSVLSHLLFFFLGFF